jgi:GntR family L-lactate dehydrogenase operon transcriptional regulator
LQDEKRARSMELITLALLDEQTEPLGSPRLVAQFHAEHIDVAEATAGRFLRAMDERGLTMRVGRQGRLITERGRQRLQHLLLVERLDLRSSELVRILSASDAEELIEILHLRRAVEGEAARLAALRATADERRRLRAFASQHQEHVQAEADGKPDALNFHLEVANAAHSSVVKATIELLIQPPNDPFMTILDIITIESGAQFAFASEHGTVADAIIARDATGAEEAMRRHIDAMIEMVARYLKTDLEGLPQPCQLV